MIVPICVLELVHHQRKPSFCNLMRMLYKCVPMLILSLAGYLTHRGYYSPYIILSESLVHPLNGTTDFAQNLETAIENARNALPTNPDDTAPQVLEIGSILKILTYPEASEDRQDPYSWLKNLVSVAAGACIGACIRAIPGPLINAALILKLAVVTVVVCVVYLLYYRCTQIFTLKGNIVNIRCECAEPNVLCSL
ncbi:uncharacterized protein LOC129588933 [Paramacrobiotus metropolitanus]|uniref:uncharacterized protein LOC129588933 n=1 Tax=Paramacrobiotus metropolitanus TaxID=2943436 RepID=UPI002446019F|nr:uncharacterized protein LOC129588933 [Paramacrobiotus metropolitanus]